MQIKLGAEQGQCKVEPISKDEGNKKYKQQLSEKNKLQKTNVFQGTVGGDGHQPEVDLVLRGKFQRKEHHQRLRICWERILPQRCLRVLLVEDDDSTRQVVSALLHHCGYEVTAVVNDLEAWELLEDPCNHFNLVLAEVMIPCLSGIGLLKKIMGHQIYRNIPVIMMSSLDSMTVIFKCLTMGAVDFLIKPVRKNELKNIWKHIWKRRQTVTSSISVCGSGRDNQDKKSVGLERASGSGNNTYSNEESNNVVGARNFQKGMQLEGRINAGNTCTDKIEIAASDKGSGTQAGNKDLEQGDEYGLDHNHNNTSSFNTIKPKKDQFQKEFVCLPETSGDCSDQKIEDCEMGKNVEFSFPREISADPQHFRDKKMVCDQICVEKKDVPSHDRVDLLKENTNLTTFGSECSEPCREAIDLIGSIARKNEERNAEEETCRTKQENDIHGKDETISYSNFSPLLELTLKRSVSILEGSLPENCCVLKPSVASAFSRYNTKCSHIEHPLGGSFPLNTHSLPKDYEHSHTLSIPGTRQTISPHRVLPFDRVNSSKRDAIDVSIPSARQPQISCKSNNQEDTSTTVGFSGQHNIPFMLPKKDGMMPALYAPSHMEMMMPVPIVYSAIPAYYGPAFHAMIYSQPGAQSKFPTKDDGTQRQDDYDISFCNDKQSMPSETPESSQHGNHHYHYHIEHHHHCCNHKNQCPHQHAKQDELSLNNSATIEAPINGLSSMVDNNNTLDGHHGEMGSSGTGSVNKTSPMTKNQTNGQNEAYHHYNHVLQYQSQEHQHPKVDKQIVKESRMTALVCSSCNNVQSGSSNGNETLNAIEHGNNSRIIEKTDHGNGQSSATVNPVTNGESGVVNGVTSGGGVDQNRSAQREAALTKFRLKRKERCFEKKVRYQSRKKLAEQRPRVKGQFVRHLVQESANGKVD